MGRMIDRRRVMGGELPYDAEVEYLKGDGHCYIDTLYYPTTTTEIEIKQIGGSNFDWGVRAGSTVGVWRYTTYWYNGHQQYMNVGNVYVVYIGKGIVTVNGQQKTTYNPITARMTLPIALFCWHNNSYTQTGNDDVSIYYFKVWEDNALVLDLIPVRVGQVGYMYDKVSKQLFGNAGTGAFILGSDKVDKGAKNVNINVKTHSTGASDASLDVITGDEEPVNIVYTTTQNDPWSNGYIYVIYYSLKSSWQLFAITPCLYDGQVYESGDLIANWNYRETKDINIVANI